MDIFIAAKRGSLEGVYDALEAGVPVDTTDSNGWTALICASVNGHANIVEKLLAAGADPNYQDYYGQTALIWASLSGHDDVLEMLLAAGADPKHQNEDGRTALTLASWKEYVNVVEKLLAAGADPNHQDEDSQTPLIWASQNGHVNVVEKLLAAGADPIHQDKNGWTALICASNNGHANIVEQLLAAGADPNHQDYNGWLALICASDNGHANIVEKLLAAGADPNHQDYEGRTALIRPSLKGDINVVEKLLAAGADPNHRDKYGRTALIYASQNEHVNVVKKLLAAGANPNHQNEDGATALIWPSYHGHVDVVEKLLAAGADPNKQDKEGRTALIRSSETGHVNVVEKLLAAGADPDHQTKDGFTALMCASCHEHGNVVENLLAAGADPNHQDKVARTVLMQASLNGDVNVVEKLLAAEADPCHQDKEGRTALIWASLNGDVNVVEKLLAAGAEPNHQDKKGMTAVIWASETGHDNVVKMLQAAGAWYKGHVVTNEWMKVHTNGRVQHEASTNIDGDYFYFKEGSTGVIKILEPMNSQLNYYEYLIVNKGQEASIGIGVGERDYPLNRMPGWNQNSCGYHADDGNLFHESGIGTTFGPTCTDGDRMGCGVDFSADSSSGYVNVFFTKNGKQVGNVVTVKKPEHGLYPLIGLCSIGEKVKYLGHSHRVPSENNESTKQDISRADSVGHPLSAKELLALKDYILPEDVIESLQQEGLDLNTIGFVRTTIEEDVQRRLDSLGQSELASSLRQHLDFALENQLHYEAYQQALEEGAAIPLKYLKVLFFGPPRTGKTSMRRRLVGEIQNLANEPVQASTGAAEVHEVIVKKVTISTAFIKKSSKSTENTTEYKWSSVKVLCGKEKCNHETDLDEELQILYQFICGTVERRLPVPDEEGLQEHTTKRLKSTLAKVEKESPTQSDSPQETDLPPNTDNKVASDSQEVSSVGEQGDGLSPEQMEEIEEANKAFNKILRRAGQEKLEDLLEDWLDKTILMNMVDTGGQPAFLEMLPALTIGPALYLIFFRLDQELKQSYELQYGKDNENFGLDDFYTNEEVIFQALSSIACFSYTTPIKKGMPNPAHAAVLIGTYKDQLGSDPKAKISEKDKELKKTLKEVLKLDLRSEECSLRPYSEDQLVFAVDNMKGDETELTEVHRRLEIIIQQMYKLDNKWKIPASWLMFSIFIRKMNKRILSLSQCHAIGNRLNVRDTNEALWFLHHHVGILMHFSDIPEIEDIVICDPQVVFDSVTDLIMDGFTFDKVGRRAEKFKTSGQFRYTDIKNIAIDPKRDILSPQQLVELLEHLNIIAPLRWHLSQSNALTPGPSPQSDAHQEQIYFMPAVLKHAKEEELRMEHSSTDLVPLIVRFTCGFVPVGVFCAMIAGLVAQEDTLGWELLEPSEHNDYTLCKNKVTFRIDYAYDITLVSSPKWYEIHVVCTPDSTSDKTLGQVSQEVLETVCDTLDKVISKMRHKHLTSFHSNETLYELGFKCPTHPDDDHLVINRPVRMKGVTASSQSAKFLWLNFHKKKSIMFCLGREIRIALPSSAQYLNWFEKGAEMSLVPSVSKLGVKPQPGHPYQSSYLLHQPPPHGAGVQSQPGYLYQLPPNQPPPNQPPPNQHPYQSSYLSHQAPLSGAGVQSQPRHPHQPPPNQSPTNQHPYQSFYQSHHPSPYGTGVQSQPGYSYQPPPNQHPHQSYLSHQPPPHGTDVPPQPGYSYQPHSNQAPPHGTGVQPQLGNPYQSYLPHQLPPRGAVATDQASFSSGGTPTYLGYDTPDMPTFTAPQFPQPCGLFSFPDPQYGTDNEAMIDTKMIIMDSTKMELNDRNILNVLHKSKFADAHWELLGMQLISHSALCNIRANRNGQANLCMIDTIAQWLRTDPAKSWEKLAEAVAKVEGYGEVTVDTVRREAGIAQ